MTLGEKIRKARKKAGLTQSELAGDFITRNMLSRIETGDANPSIQTIQYLAEKLELDAGLLLAKEDNTDTAFKSRMLPLLKKAYLSNEYALCISFLSDKDLADCDEASLIESEIRFRLSLEHYKTGKLKSAEEQIKLCRKCAEKCAYPTDGVLMKCCVLEHKISEILRYISPKDKREISQDLFSEFNEIAELDGYLAEANLLISEKNEAKAEKLLLNLLDNFGKKNIPFVYGLYGLLEVCTREQKRFEEAYKYSRKAAEIYEQMQN